MKPQKYSQEPEDPQAFTRQFNRIYSSFAPLYNFLLDVFPVWHHWIDHALPHIEGPKVLEVSFGTGHLMAQYAKNFNTFGVDLNVKMSQQAASRLGKAGSDAYVQIANVEHIPYKKAGFDTVINTMAFSGYPDGEQALREMRRVLKPAGKLVMIDVNFPRDGNFIGTALARFWIATGDLIRDVPGVFHAIGWSCQDFEVGGYGSVHLYLAEK